MARITDRERIVNLLIEHQSLSNRRIREGLGLGDERYDKLRNELLNEGIVEKTKGQGGGIQLSKKGERIAKYEDDTESAYEREPDMYPDVVDAIVREARGSVVFETGSLRKSGKWQNPDVTELSVETYPRQQMRRVIVTTYEVKRWREWDVRAVFEAASHARFAHFGYVCLEWPEPGFALTDPRIYRIVEEATRFGIGIATLTTHYKHHRVRVWLDPVAQRADYADVEEWLEYALSRRQDAASEFDALMAATQLHKSALR